MTTIDQSNNWIEAANAVLRDANISRNQISSTNYSGLIEGLKGGGDITFEKLGDKYGVLIDGFSADHPMFKDVSESGKGLLEKANDILKSANPSLWIADKVGGAIQQKYTGAIIMTLGAIVIALGLLGLIFSSAFGKKAINVAAKTVPGGDLVKSAAQSVA